MWYQFGIVEIKSITTMIEYDPSWISPWFPWKQLNRYCIWPWIQQSILRIYNKYFFLDEQIQRGLEDCLSCLIFKYVNANLRRRLWEDAIKVENHWTIHQMNFNLWGLNDCHKFCEYLLMTPIQTALYNYALGYNQTNYTF